MDEGRYPRSWNGKCRLSTLSTSKGKYALNFIDRTIGSIKEFDCINNIDSIVISPKIVLHYRYVGYNE